MDKLKNHTKRLFHRLLKLTGFLFIILGVIGLIFPVIPGLVFLILGIIILGEESFVASWIINRLPQKQREKVKNYFSRRKGGNDNDKEDS